MRALRSLMLALPVVALMGCPAGSGDLTLDASSAAALSIVNEDGPVTLVGQDTAEIVVGWTGHSDEGAPPSSAIDVTAVLSGTTATILAVTAGPEYWIDLQVDAPGDLPCSVDSGAGDVVLQDLVAGCSVGATTGNVFGSGLQGDLTVDSDIAEIDLELTIAGGETITVALGSGPITLRMPEDTDALLDAVATGGEVEIQGIPFSGVNEMGAASGELGAGATAQITVTTGDGDILIVAE